MGGDRRPNGVGLVAAHPGDGLDESGGGTGSEHDGAGMEEKEKGGKSPSGYVERPPRPTLTEAARLSWSPISCDISDRNSVSATPPP